MKKQRRSMSEISKDIEKNNAKRPKSQRKPIRRKVKPIGIDDVLSMLIFNYAIDVYDREGDRFIGTFGKNNIVLCPEDYIYRPALRK